MHISDWNCEASVDNQSQDKHRCRRHSLSKSTRKGTNGSEDHGHCQDTGEGKQVEGKKGGRRSSKVGHKYSVRLKKMDVVNLFGKSQIMDAIASENG